MRDPWTKSYIFNWITIDEALRTEKAFLPQDVIYELSINKKDIHWKEIYIWDIISRRWKYKKRVDENRMIDKEFEHKDMCAVLWDSITPPYCYDIEFVINWNIHKDPEKWLAQPNLIYS